MRKTALRLLSAASAFTLSLSPAVAGLISGGPATTPTPPGYVIANYPNAACEQVPSTWGGTGSAVVGGTNYYVDPGALGNNTNSGLFGHPWKTWAKAKTAYAAGDTINLYGGNYGEAFDTQNKVNGSWTRVIPVSGQTPVFTSLEMSGSQRWFVQGVKIQSNPGAPNSTALGNIGHGTGTAKNIVIDSGNFSTDDNGSAWTQTQWKNANFYGLLLYGSTETSYDVNCIAVSRTLFAYDRTNMQINGRYILVADNEFSNPGWDMIDGMGDHLSILRNYAHDSHDVDCDPADPVNSSACNHVDFFQAQQGECVAAYCLRSNYIIDGNIVIERTSPSITTSTEDVGAFMDGIAIWDEALDTFAITNNVFITSSTNPLTVGNAYNGTIANNVVIATDNGGTDSGHYGINVQLHGNATPIGAPVSHDVRVFNNAASNITIESPGSTNTADHNDILAGGWYADNTGTFNKAAGTYGTNTVRSQALTSYFTTYNYSTRTWDTHLKVGSLGLGAGTATGAPNKADGTARTGSVDVGNY